MKDECRDCKKNRHCNTQDRAMGMACKDFEKKGEKEKS